MGGSAKTFIVTILAVMAGLFVYGIVSKKLGISSYDESYEEIE